MKRLIVVGAFALTAWLGYQWSARDPEVALAPTPQGTPAHTSDQEAVFKRAFWKRPGPGDHIQNAILSEWSDTEAEVSRWQWFIEVEASSELKQWLQTRNPIVENGQLPVGASRNPDWFPNSMSGFDTHRSRDGKTTLLFSQKGNLLFATASGYGFAKGAPAPPAPLPSPSIAGRLPNSPPPIPPSPK